MSESVGRPRSMTSGICVHVHIHQPGTRMSPIASPTDVNASSTMKVSTTSEIIAPLCRKNRRRTI